MLGIAAAGRRAAGAWRALPAQGQASWLLTAGWLLLTGASYLGYNLSFKQHQGRYLFPALTAVALLLSLGWAQVTRRALRRAGAGFLLLLAAFVSIQALLHGRYPDKLLLASFAGLGAAFVLASLLPERWARWLYALPYPLLVALDLVCLYRFVIPRL